MRTVARLLLAGTLFLAGCEREDVTTAAPATSRPGSARESVIETESDFIRDLRHKALGGDAAAMLTLGQAYQTQGASSEARQWFEKARTAGSAQAEEALAELDEADARTRSAATQPDDPPPPGTAATGPTTATAAGERATSRAALDRSKVSWEEIIGSFDTENFRIETQPDSGGKFVALARAEDQTMILAATGPGADAITGVQMIVRIRNRQGVEESLRVRQAGAICATVTRDNVRRSEAADWIKSYLASEQALPPIYRSGWQIIVTGPRAEGRTDGKSDIGAAVKIDLSR